jgi:hypothetical protein
MPGQGVVDEAMRAYYEQRAAEYGRVLHAGDWFVMVAALR